MELSGELHRGADDWLLTLEDGCRRLQVMVAELSWRSHEEPEDAEGAISPTAWVKSTADGMLDVIWELEEGPDPQQESCIDWTRARSMMSSCYVLFAEGGNLCFKLEKRLKGDDDIEDVIGLEIGALDDKANSGVSINKCNNNGNNSINSDKDYNNNNYDNNNGHSDIENKNISDNNDFSCSHNNNGISGVDDNNNNSDGDGSNNNGDDSGCGDDVGSDAGNRDVGIGDDHNNNTDGDDNNKNRDGDHNNNNCGEGRGREVLGFSRENLAPDLR
ncbi:hypothetical protein CBR_g29337 [Chara braunii]|uniref:Uncharacterized protein n=1 Tax=Chara braunii TaxID=69332 RepID=A0A388JWI4_CHABU|nr:hypothetical protein CBR_g29337 [Chara braunii]|eukprot:GBG62138.1 hypothetical protein CBR_g29337 [Chara braunii]